MKTTLVMPAKNEESTISAALTAAAPFVDEIIVVDGSSTDGTIAAAERCGAKVVRQNGRGKGDALRLGIKLAGGDVIVFMDADGSHEPSDIPKLTAPIASGEADMVVASRAKGGSDEVFMTVDGMIRHTGGYIAAMIINYRWGSSLTEVENGFRAVRTSAARAMNLSTNGFEIEQEIVIKALKNKFKVTEVGSHEYARRGGQSKLPTRSAWRFVAHIIKEMLTGK